MVNTNYLLTSESVSEGHPDKMADQISDGILDALLAQDPMSRVACETSLTTGLVLVFLFYAGTAPDVGAVVKAMCFDSGMLLERLSGNSDQKTRSCQAVSGGHRTRKIRG